MATVEEVLATMSEEDYLHDVQFVINENLRTIAVPAEGVVAGVVGDKNVNRICFSMSRYYNGFDMSEFDACINYSNANGESNSYEVDDISVEGDSLLFSWLVDSDVTAYVGKVAFTVKMEKTTNSSIVKVFNTTIATVSVLEGFDVEDRTVVPDIIDDRAFGYGENPSCDADIPRIYLYGDATMMSKENSVDLGIRYCSNNLNFNGAANVKWQGNSSLNYDKKNFTIKLFTDSTKSKKLNVNFKKWGAFDKFVLKANYIDFSHARNIVSARLWSKMVSERTGYNQLPVELRTAPNNGAIDGFLVKVYMNGVYQGRYTLNYGKESIMWNMDKDNPNHAALCSENYVSGCFAAEAEIDESDWSLEFPKTLTDDIKDSFNDAISFVMESTDAEFVANIGNYFNLESLIDYYIFAYVSNGLDSMGKNQIFLTYDGVHWIASMYDMDSTWGLYWDGSCFVSSRYRCQEDYESGYHRPDGANQLYTRLATLFKSEIKTRYQSIRRKSLSASSIIEEFDRFMAPCSKALVERDLTPYPNIPSSDVDHADQINQYIYERLMYVDRMINDGIIRENFSPNGTTWSDIANLDFEEGDYIEAKIDSIGPGVTENILSIGAGRTIKDWYNDWTTIHLYTTETDDGRCHMLLCATSCYEDHSLDHVYVDLPVTIKLSKDGVYINGELQASTDKPEYYQELITEVLQNNFIIIGSEEGADRSNAHYEYIKVAR